MSRPEGEKLTGVKVSDSVTIQPVRVKTTPLKYLALCFCALLVGWTAAGFPAGSNILGYLSVFDFTNRYYVANHAQPLVPWKPGTQLSIPVEPFTEAWYLVAAPAAVAAKFPDKKCYVLRTDKTDLYLSTMRLFAPENKPQTDTDLLSTDATIADASLAWPFVLNGTWKSGKFKGRLVSPDGRYKFSVHPPPEGWVGVVGRPIMSPDPDNEYSSWTLDHAFLSEGRAWRRWWGHWRRDLWYRLSTAVMNRLHGVNVAQ